MSGIDLLSVYPAWHNPDPIVMMITAMVDDENHRDKQWKMEPMIS
jgi:hypothetical protein